MAIASGVIFPFNGTHAGVPTGFTRETTLDDRHPLGSPASTNPDVTGGASTHTHTTSHTHTVGSHTHAGITTGTPSLTTAVAQTSAPTSTFGTNTHTHTTPTTGSQTATLNDNGTDVTTSGSSVPSSYEVIWIKSDGSPVGVPNNGWALLGAGSVPTGWTAQSGPAGLYLVGATTGANAGGTRGSATHSHSGVSHTHAFSSHAHTIGVTGAPSTTIARTNTGAQSGSSATHTHTNTIQSATVAASAAATSGASGSTDVAPAYRKVAVIQNGTGGDSAPSGIIALWLGTLASIPSPWVLCDGANGTVDLRDKMIIASAADLSDLGGTGGGTSHDHTDSSTHTHDASHTHTIDTTGSASDLNTLLLTGTGNAARAHTHTGGASGSGGGTSGATSEAIANASAYPPYRTVAYIQYNIAVTNTRTVTPNAINLIKTNTRTVTPAAINLLKTNTRTVTPAAINLLKTNTRTINPAAVNLLKKNTRTITPAAINLLKRNTRTITPAAINLLKTGNTRTVTPAAINLLKRNTRTVTPATVNLKKTNTRTITPTAVNLAAHLTRTVPASIDLLRLTLTPVTPVPTAPQIEDALSGRTGAVDLRFRYTRRTRTNGFIDNIDAVIIPGAITLDNSRPVVRDLDVTFAGDLLPSDFNVTTDILGVAVEVYVPSVGVWASIPCGLYLLDVAESHYRGGNLTIPAKGADLATFLVRNIRTGSYTVTAGTNYVEAVETIIANHGLAYSIPASTLVLPNDITWPAGVSDYDITRDLLFGINYYPLWADAIGTIRSRERIDPSTETAAVNYRNDQEPKMISAMDDYVRATDRKPGNRASVVIDDPRHADFGYVVREDADPDAPNSTATLVYGDAVGVSSSSPASPTLITTDAAHGFATGVQVLISGHSGATPAINGSFPVTVISPTTFTIPINVSVGGSGGTVQATSVQAIEYKGDSTPSTRAMFDATLSGEVADFEVRWAALLAQHADLGTFLDPRRDAHEFYSLTYDAIETAQLVGALGWTMQLKEGQIMQHSIGRAVALDILSPPTA